MELIKKLVSIVLSVALLMIILVFCVKLQDSDSIGSLTCIVKTIDGDNESISLFERDGKYYALLPSFADLKNVRILSEAGYDFSLDGSSRVSTYECTDLNIDKEYTLKTYNWLGVQASTAQFVIMKAQKTPSLYIQLSNGTLNELNSDKEIEKSGIAKLIDSEGNVDFSGNFKSIHGRGNSTWLGSKKPYSIEFEQATSLLNMKKGIKYNLLANRDSNFRNKIALDLALRSNVKHALNSEFLDLYINGDYCGFYLLTESIEIGEDRINISNLQDETQELNQLSLKQYTTFDFENQNYKMKGYSIPKSPQNITGGYVLEMEYPGRFSDHNSAFFTNSSVCYGVWAPKYASYDEVEYIRRYMNRVEGKMDDDKFDEVLDVDSFVDFYIIQELLANTDNASFYFSKEKNQDLLCAGPIWDFDLALCESIYEINVEPASSIKTISENSVFYKLCSGKKFMNEVKKRYKGFFYKEIESIYLHKIEEYSKRIQKSYNMDLVRWSYDKSSNPDGTITYTQHSISDFLRRRNNAFKKKWIEGKRDCTIQLLSFTGVNLRKYISVGYGEIPNEPELQCESFEFLGYYNDKTDEKLDLSKPVYESGTYTAKWKPLSDSVSSENLNSGMSLRERLRSILSNETIVTISIVIIIVLITLFVLFDIHCIKKKRRYSNGRKS